MLDCGCLGTEVQFLDADGPAGEIGREGVGDGDEDRGWRGPDAESERWPDGVRVERVDEAWRGKGRLIEWSTPKRFI